MKDDLQREKWQSINKTNQESKYLQFCRAKAYYVVQHTFLTEAAFNFITLQDPLRLLYVLCKSSSSNWVTEFESEIQSIYTKLLWFILLW